MKKTVFCLISLLGLYTCKEKTGSQTDFSNSDRHSFSLIKTCVDIVILTHKQINTKNYVVNLSDYEVLGLTKRGVDSFISIKNAVLPTSHDDSVILGSGNDTRMLQSMLISFHKITKKENGTVAVEILKFLSAKEKVSFEIILSRRDNGYFLLSATEIN